MAGILFKKNPSRSARSSTTVVGSNAKSCRTLGLCLIWPPVSIRPLCAWFHARDHRRQQERTAVAVGQFRGWGLRRERAPWGLPFGIWTVEGNRPISVIHGSRRGNLLRMRPSAVRTKHGKLVRKWASSSPLPVRKLSGARTFLR
jgi:hypothetical protein